MQLVATNSRQALRKIFSSRGIFNRDNYQKEHFKLRRRGSSLFLTECFIKITNRTMPINLGLQRITKLLGHLNNPQNAYKSIHIAGTNGKGSTLAYISSVLTEAKIKNGKFTSPHIIDYHDCITINNQTYPKSKFDRINEQVMRINNDLKLECTEFEILTATAFKIFALEEIEMALVEVGVGGRLDATNVLVPYGETTNGGGVVATAITKIGLDHEKLLGGTLLTIAKEKSGIMKHEIPCFVDSLNESIILQAIHEKSQEISCPLSIVEPIKNQFIQYSPLKGSYQANNLSLAVEILKCLPYKISEEILINGIRKTNWPGRLQTIPHKSLGPILLDGAHNESAAIELGKYLNTKYPKQESESDTDAKNELEESNHKPIVFVIGMTKGKAVANLLKHVVSEEDIVIPTLFTQPENMPWIKPELISTLTSIAEDYCHDVRNIGDDVHIHQVFQYLEDKTLENKPIVVCGSLYLCGDVLREIAN